MALESPALFGAAIGSIELLADGPERNHGQDG
jgi:hypothetical protein